MLAALSARPPGESIAMPSKTAGEETSGVEAPGLVPGQVLDALEQGVLALDRERRILYANRRCEELVGMPPEELVGLPATRVFPGLEAKWLRGESRQPREFRVETEGREATLKVEAFPLRGDTGAVVGHVLVADAVAETEGGEFQKKIDRLVSLGELSAYVAHEIRNPLTGIRTTVQFVSSKLKPADSRREDLDDVIKELDRIEQIITGLLLFARPQAGRPMLSDLQALVDKTLDNLELQMSAGGVKVEKSYLEDLPKVWVDPDLVQQVFLNLCLNSVQAMPEGGTLTVTTAVRRPRTRKQYVDVSFSDTGPGIPKENMEKIFDPFFTTRSMGTGLGLPISLEIVRDHGGVISARNNSSGGATFRVSLPLPVEPPEER
jgi:two-component system sensor histidine kinase HydH